MDYVSPFNDGGDDDAPWIDGNPAIAQEGSIPRAIAFEHPLRELHHLIHWASTPLGGRAALDNGIPFGPPAPSDLQQVRKAVEFLIRGGARIRLTGPLTVYVRSDGNDTNDGLENTPERAFLSIQGAWDHVKRRYDPAGYTLTIQIGLAGTYAGAFFDNMGVTGEIVVRGDPLLPNSFIVVPPFGQNWCFASQMQWVKPTGLLLDNTASGISYTLWAGLGGRIHAVDCNFRRVGSSNTSLRHCHAQVSGVIHLGGNITVLSAPGIMIASFADVVAKSIIGTLNTAEPLTMTFSSNVEFADAFLEVADASAWWWGSSTTWVGSFTGKRYNATLNGVIHTAGAGANFFPGSVAGTTSLGGLYN